MRSFWRIERTQPPVFPLAGLDIACAARDRLGFDVNIQRVTVQAWRMSEDTFLDHVRPGPLIELTVSGQAT